MSGDHDGYIYPPTGEKLTRVTTILDDTHGKQRFLTPWGSRIAAEYAVDNIKLLNAILAGEVITEEQREKDLSPRDAAVSLTKNEAARIREVKADAGSYVHSVVEALVLWAASPEGTGSSLALPQLPEELQDALYDDQPLPDVTDWMIEGFLNFCADWKPEFIASEMTVYNVLLGYAGTLDLIAKLNGYAIGRSERFVPAPGQWVQPVVDIKTGRNLDVTWREQVSAYRQAPECLLPMGELAATPPSDCAAVLHLRPEHPRGYRLMLVSRKNYARAWNTFRRAVEVYRDRVEAKPKPGKVVYPLRDDGTIPQPRLADLDGEGYGRAISPLIKAGVPDLEALAGMTAGDCLKVKGIASKTLEVVRVMLADHGLSLRDEQAQEVA